jgi:hypothetical protein
VTYDEIHPVIRAAIGAHEGFRKLGFSSDNLFCELAATPGAPAGQVGVFMTLQSRGKAFRVGVGYWAANDEPGARAAWTSAVTAVNAHEVSEADLDRIWAESYPCRDKVGFVTALLDKGFVASTRLLG